MDYYEAINCKGWTKSFVMEELQPDMEGKIINYTKYLRGINPDQGDSFAIVRFKDMRRRYRELFASKAPYYMVIYLDDLQGQLINAGYLMGQMALYLMTKDIGSCVIGVERVKGTDHTDLFQNALVVSQNEQQYVGTYMAIMAFGRPEHHMKQFSKAGKKLLVEKKCIYKSNTEPNIGPILSAIAHAPSRLFLSPYRYVISDNRVHIYTKNDVLLANFQRMYVYLECGIQLAYLGVKAEELWMSMNVKQVQRLAEKELNHFQYLVSLTFENQ